MADSLTGQDVDAKPALIKVLDEDGTTSQRRDQVDIAVVQQVIFFTGEATVGLLLDLENDISSLDPGCLVALATELDLGAALNALVDVDVEDLPVNNGLLSVALLAAVLVLNNLALTVAVRADSLEPLDHGTHLAHHGLHTVAITAGTLLNGTILATDTGALGADDGPLKSKFRDLAAVNVLERHLVGVVNSAGLGRSAVVHTAEHTSHAAHPTEAAAAEELCEEVLSSHAAAGTSTALEAGLTILIINLTLLRI